MEIYTMNYVLAVADRRGLYDYKYASHTPRGGWR